MLGSTANHSSMQPLYCWACPLLANCNKTETTGKNSMFSQTQFTWYLALNPWVHILAFWETWTRGRSRHANCWELRKSSVMYSQRMEVQLATWMDGHYGRHVARFLRGYCPFHLRRGLIDSICFDWPTQDAECCQVLTRCQKTGLLSFLLDVRISVLSIGTWTFKQGDTQSGFVPDEKVDGGIKNFVLPCSTANSCSTGVVVTLQIWFNDQGAEEGTVICCSSSAFLWKLGSAMFGSLSRAGRDFLQTYHLWT